MYKSDFVPKENGSYSIGQHSQFYQNSMNVAKDTKAYSVTVFESSPLNRIIKQGAAGNTWQPNPDATITNDRVIRKEYDFNQPTDKICQFKFDPIKGLTINQQVKYYPDYSLYVNKTYDENFFLVVEFKDKEGRTICEKVQLAGSSANPEFAETYYVYDDSGNLVLVLPPQGMEKLRSELNLN